MLFKGIYHLVAVSFGGDEGQHSVMTEIRKTGEIPVRVLERISTQSSSTLLTNEHIIELLKYFKILAELHSNEKIVYFMPAFCNPTAHLSYLVRHCRLCTHLLSLFALMATTFPLECFQL